VRRAGAPVAPALLALPQPGRAIPVLPAPHHAEALSTPAFLRHFAGGTEPVRSSAGRGERLQVAGDRVEEVAQSATRYRCLPWPIGAGHRQPDPFPGGVRVKRHVVVPHGSFQPGLHDGLGNMPLPTGQRRVCRSGAQVEAHDIRTARAPGRPEHHAPAIRPWPGRIDQQRHAVRGLGHRSGPAGAWLPDQADRIGRVREGRPHNKRLTIRPARRIGRTTAFGLRQRSWSQRTSR
jgi:hypothetical protein